MKKNKYNLQINRFQIGDDIVFIITGGKAHIGAVATSSWKEGGIETHLHALPGHKEGDLSLEMAEYASAHFQCTVTVIMGIHIDQPTKEMICEIVELVREMMQREIKNATEKN